MATRILTADADITTTEVSVSPGTYRFVIASSTTVLLDGIRTELPAGEHVFELGKSITTDDLDTTNTDPDLHVALGTTTTTTIDGTIEGDGTPDGFWNKIVL